MRPTQPCWNAAPAARRGAAALAALALAASIGCGGGGGGGGGGGPTAPPLPSGISFSAASAPTSGSCFLRQGPQTNPAKLFLEVRVNDVEDWYGVAFDLTFPAGQLSYLRATEGPARGERPR